GGLLCGTRLRPGRVVRIPHPRLRVEPINNGFGAECHSDKPDSFHVAAAAGRPKCNESAEKPGKKAEERVVRFTRAARWRDRETWNARRVSLIRMPFGTGVNATGLAAHAAYKTPRCPGQEPEPDAQV